MSPDIEEQLLEYLKEQKASDLSRTMKTIADWTQTHTKEDEVKHAEIMGAMRGHSLRIGALERNDDKIDRRLEQSGSWQIEAEQAKAMAAKSVANWWRDKTVTVIVGLVMLMLGGAVSFLTKH